MKSNGVVFEFSLIFSRPCPPPQPPPNYFSAATALTAISILFSFYPQWKRLELMRDSFLKCLFLVLHAEFMFVMSQMDRSFESFQSICNLLLFPTFSLFVSISKKSNWEKSGELQLSHLLPQAPSVSTGLQSLNISQTL